MMIVIEPCLFLTIVLLQVYCMLSLLPNLDKVRKSRLAEQPIWLAIRHEVLRNLYAVCTLPKSKAWQGNPICMLSPWQWNQTYLSRGLVISYDMDLASRPPSGGFWLLSRIILFVE